MNKEKEDFLTFDRKQKANGKVRGEEMTEEYKITFPVPGKGKSFHTAEELK